MSFKFVFAFSNKVLTTSSLLSKYVRALCLFGDTCYLCVKNKEKKLQTEQRQTTATEEN